jgi:hypothetical protein
MEKLCSGPAMSVPVLNKAVRCRRKDQIPVRFPLLLPLTVWRLLRSFPVPFQWQNSGVIRFPELPELPD